MRCAHVGVAIDDLLMIAQVGMWVVKVGGPAYRIGLGGGAASSRVGDAGTVNLDFDAVQVSVAQPTHMHLCLLMCVSTSLYC